MTDRPPLVSPLVQTRLGNQNAALAVQAVRTVRGNSFCIDCDAPSECRGQQGPVGWGSRTAAQRLVGGPERKGGGVFPGVSIWLPVDLTMLPVLP